MRRILLTPGPVTTTEAVKKEMLVDYCPREKNFSEIIDSVRSDLLKLANANSKYGVVLFNSSGTGAMEACVNAVSTIQGVTSSVEQAILILSNGLYGERFYNIACNLRVGSFTQGHRWGQKLDLKLLNSILNGTENRYSAVFMTHHETSTGILNDIKEISNITKKYKIPLVVDCVSSFGAIPIDIKDSGADFIISTSNKCIQSTPGVSFVIFKKENIREMLWNSRSTYFNIADEYDFQEREHQFRFTAPVQPLLSFRKALDELIEEGIENRYKRYSENYRRMVAGMLLKGFKRYLPDDIPRSRLMETFLQPEWINFTNFHNRLFEEGISIYPGVLNKKTFRVSVMGDIHSKDIENFLNKLGIIKKENERKTM